MNKRWIEDFVFYWIVQGFRNLLGLLPYSWAVPLGASILYGFSFFYPRRFDIAYSNIKTAFPDLKPARVKHLVRKSVFNLSLSLMEFILIYKLDKEKLFKLIEVKGLENLDSIGNRGTIFLTAHYDNWELIAIFGALYGYPSYVIAREQKYPRLNSLLNRERMRFGNVVVEKGLSIKKAIQALKAGNRIGILADQNAGKNGLQVKFFGKYASTNPGFIYLARRASAVILPVFIRRISLLRHQIVIHPPLDLSGSEKDVIQKYHNILESYIKKNPEQWLWFHKRWKHSIHKKILILSDSKPGHVRQSRVIGQKLKFALHKKYKNIWPQDEPEIEIKEIEVKWPNKIIRTFCYLSGMFSSSRCQGCLRCLYFTLPCNVYSQLIFEKFDYIISTGSSLVPINVILGYENKSRNICILDPGLGYRKKFDKLFIPEHDRVRGKNVVCFQGAIVDKDNMFYKGEEFISQSNLILDPRALKIGLLIGGDTKYAKFNIRVLKHFLNKLQEIASQGRLELLITTSRRTPKEMEEFFQKFKHPYVKLMIIANQDNPPGGVEAIFKSVDIIFVTCDSISMISEAIASGKKVAIIMTAEVDKKFKRFLYSVSQRPGVRLISENEFKNLKRVIEEIEANSETTETSDEIISKSLEELL